MTGRGPMGGESSAPPAVGSEESVSVCRESPGSEDTRTLFQTEITNENERLGQGREGGKCEYKENRAVRGETVRGAEGSL